MPYVIDYAPQNYVFILKLPRKQGKFVGIREKLVKGSLTVGQGVALQSRPGVVVVDGRKVVVW